MTEDNSIRVIGTYISEKFGELWDKSLEDLVESAVQGVLQNTGNSFNPSEVEAVFVANMASGQFSNQLHLNALVSQLFDHYPAAIRVEGACASGSLAMIAAQDALTSGRYQTVMVLGVEKMNDSDSSQATKVLSSASQYEFEYGSTFPGLYALLAKAHMHKYGTTRKHLSAVSAKNHQHALSNSKAQFNKAFSLEQVSESTLVADPLRLLDCSPVSDGASAVILSNKTEKYQNKPKIVGVGHAQDSLNLANRKSLTSLSATKKAAKEAYKKAGITPQDITVAEVHDCFTIAEILAIEDLGFFKPGSGGRATLSGKTTHGGKVVINPSGGLKACGHPVGATGVKQIAYLSDLIEKSDEFGKYALAHNVGGSGATVVVHILEK